VEFNIWKNRFNNLIPKENYLRTLAFMRILGYLITDGNIYHSNNNISGSIYLGHMIDVKSMLDDLELLLRV